MNRKTGFALAIGRSIPRAFGSPPRSSTSSAQDAAPGDLPASSSRRPAGPHAPASVWDGVQGSACGGAHGGGGGGPLSPSGAPNLRRFSPIAGLLTQSNIVNELKDPAGPSYLVGERGRVDIKLSAQLEAQDMMAALAAALAGAMPELHAALGADTYGGGADESEADFLRKVTIKGGLMMCFGDRVLTWTAQRKPGRDEDVVPNEVARSLDALATLGGDGTMLWACKMMGNNPVPPIVPFAMGSLGFMTPFSSAAMPHILQAVSRGAVHLLLRHRLECWVIRKADLSNERPATEAHVILNDVSLHRGTSPYLTNLEVYCDDTFVTNVQGDGLILATPTGSTAYSLAAGGSMVHPSVPGIIFTPICPHSLSFRPLVFPDHVQLRVQVPESVRNTEMRCSFDGSHHIALRAGDALVVQMSQHPVPTVCDVNVSHDWFCSVREGLYWNLRKMQGAAEGKQQGGAE